VAYRWRDKKQGPKEADYLVNDDLRGIFLPEDLFRFLGYIACQKREGKDRQQVYRPCERSKD